MTIATTTPRLPQTRIVAKQQASKQNIGSLSKTGFAFHVFIPRAILAFGLS